MRVRDLIAYLEEFDEEMEVKMVYQPNYPMQVEIDDVREAEGKVYLCQMYNGNDYAPEGLID